MTIPSNIILGIVFDTDITQLNGTGTIFTLLLLASYYWDRIICLNQCLKDQVEETDVTRVKCHFFIVALWAVIAFIGFGTILKLNYFICLAIYCVGWGLLSIYDRPLLTKVEDPSKKRTHFLNLLPKEPPHK